MNVKSEKPAFIRKREWSSYAAALLVGVLIIVSLLYLKRSGEYMVAAYAPLVDAAMEIKLEAAIAHLWFEEIISGDRYENIETVWAHLDQSAWYATAMLEGGENEEGVFIPLDDPALRSEIVGTQEKLASFRAIAEERFAAMDTAGIGTPIDQEFDAVFAELLQQTDEVETELQRALGDELRQFKQITNFIILLSVAALGSVFVAFFRFQRQLAASLHETRQGQESLRITLDAIGDAVIATDTHGNVTRMNPVAEKLTGWPFDESAGQPLTAVFHIVNAQTGAKAENPVDKVLENGRIVGLANHTMLIAKDGREFQIADSGAPIRDDAGDITGVVLVFRDVTEEYQVQETLRQNEEKFRGLVEASSDWIWETNADGVYTYASPRVEAMLGHRPEEVVGKTPFDLMPAAEAARMAGIFKDLVEKGKPIVRLENVNLHKDGRSIVLETSGVPIIDAAGNVCGYRGVDRDITKRMQAEETSKESEERYKGIVQSTASCIAVYKPIDQGQDFVFTDFNPMAERVENIAKEKVIGKKVTELFPGVKEFGLLDVFQKVWETGEPEHFPISVYQDSRIQGYRENYVYKLETGEIVAVYQDLTEKKQIEKELEKHRAHLEEMVAERTVEVEKLNSGMVAMLEDLQNSKREVEESEQQLKETNAELETFTYSVSHDLKAPLRGIDGYGRLLLDDYADKLDEEGRFFIHTIRNATQQMKQLIDDLLAYSRLQRRALTISAVNPHALVDALLAELAADIDAKEIAVHVDMPCASVAAEAEGLAQALRNLIGNAIKFSRDAAEPRIEVGGRAEGEHCILWVRDNGPGFDMKYHERIFEIFQRLHSAQEYAGTGIGLAIVRTAMKRMNGRVWAESAPGEGATFYLEIPRGNITRRGASSNE